MCGFLGQYSLQLSSINEFLENLAIAKHCGPDQTGYWVSDKIQFGFNRLAILDLSSAGEEPMKSNSGDWQIEFNGEIYNQKDLRKVLNNYSFKRHSDTETIIACLEQKGFEETI